MPAPHSIGQRFTQLIQHLGLSKNAFAQSLDKTATVIQHLVDERNKPGYDLLCKVFETYPNVSKDWLMLGQGEMLLAAEPAPPAAAAAISAAPPASAAPAPAPAAAPAALLDLLAEAPEPPSLLRRRPTLDSALLQPADIAATVALAAAHAPRPAGLANSEATPAPVVAPAAPVAPAITAAPAAGPAPDPAYLTAALQTQYLQHQLALAEQRNQHLLEQQSLMQQLVALLQRNVG